MSISEVRYSSTLAAGTSATSRAPVAGAGIAKLTRVHIVLTMQHAQQPCERGPPWTQLSRSPVRSATIAQPALEAPCWDRAGHTLASRQPASCTAKLAPLPLELINHSPGRARQRRRARSPWNPGSTRPSGRELPDQCRALCRRAEKNHSRQRPMPAARSLDRDAEYHDCKRPEERSALRRPCNGNK